MPLYHDPHQQQHQADNEVAWWHDLDIKRLENAKGLWAETRPKSAPVVIAPTSSGEDAGSNIEVNVGELQ